MVRLKETLRFIEMEWQIVWYWHLKRKLVKHMDKMADHLLRGYGSPECREEQRKICEILHEESSR